MKTEPEPEPSGHELMQILSRFKTKEAERLGIPVKICIAAAPQYVIGTGKLIYRFNKFFVSMRGYTYKADIHGGITDDRQGGGASPFTYWRFPDENGT